MSLSVQTISVMCSRPKPLAEQPQGVAPAAHARNPNRHSGSHEVVRLVAEDNSVRFIHAHGSQAGIQARPRQAQGQHRIAVEREPRRVPGGWAPIGRINVLFSTGLSRAVRASCAEELPGVVGAFASAARGELAAGFDVVEVHAAHGSLAHQFQSLLSNDRVDECGGSFDHRARLCLEIAEAVRRVWPETRPVFVRISATDRTRAARATRGTVDVLFIMC
jgi:2,4-dienoyl-CoA reductase-like NADH-dependent reductase (Old Yellow Enzyme family)